MLEPKIIHNYIQGIFFENCTMKGFKTGAIKKLFRDSSETDDYDCEVCCLHNNKSIFL